MSVGKSSNKESSSSNSNSQGSYSNENTGFFENNPIISDDWKAREGSVWDMINGGGFTPSQGSAMQHLNNWMDKDATTLKSVQNDYPDQYQELSPVEASKVVSQNVGVERGGSNISGWENPYTSSVVDASLSDLNNAYQKVSNNSDLAQAAVNPNGWGGSGHGVRQAQVDDDYLRNVAATSSGLRNQGFNTAAGLTQQDKGFDLQGQSITAQNDLTAQLSNQNALMQQQMYNNDMQNRRDMFDIGQAGMADQYRMGAATGLFNMGQGGIENATNLLGLGTSTFGQGGTSGGTDTGTYDNRTNSTGRGSSSGKNAGVQLI